MRVDGKGETPAVICITPVRNEAWILERFIRAALMWADRIVIVDHASDDGSREIAARFEQVTLVPYDEEAFDEPERRSLLIETARRVAPPGRKCLLMGIDADEALTANFAGSDGWRRALAAEPGTNIRMRWANVLPECRECWVPSEYRIFGFMDDGSDFEPHEIHGPRLPGPADGPSVDIDDVCVLHFQYADWRRLKSKQRWYQVWEWLNTPDKRAIPLYRQYHHMDTVSERERRPIPESWTGRYREAGVDFSRMDPRPFYRWDPEVVEILAEHGPERFRKLNIWDVDWDEIARCAGCANGRALADPRSPLDRRIHQWLGRTQDRMHSVPVRVVQNLLRAAGW
jgi:hypothetical protein